VFGIYRYLLALMVVVSHHAGDAANFPGMYAVFGFYLLSGFLMCRVRQTTYPWTPTGLGRFALNRALRIYPPYLAAAALGLAVAALAPGADQWRTTLGLPITLTDWLPNLLIVGLPPSGLFPKLVGAAWSLHVELALYLAVALLPVERPRIALAWLAISLAYTAWLIASAAGFNPRYYPVEAASLPFSLGVCLAHLRVRWHWRIHLPIGALAFSAITLLSPRCCVPMFGWGLYAALAAAAYLTVSLSQSAVRDAAPTWLRRLDRVLGDLAYPIFLVHLAAGVLTATTLGLPTKPSFVLFGAALPVVHLAAFLIHRGVERPIERFRARVRTGLGRTTLNSNGEPGPVHSG
jgi:peptidoglycan/LPS O-acetylase OafA/YrhL